MTHRPEITAEKYKEVYDYYEESRVKPHLSNLVYRTSNVLFRPDVHIEDETREVIEAQMALGKGVLLAMNHPSKHDAFVGAASMYESGIDGLTDCMAFAKDSLFRGPTRPIFEYTGCVPVFRHKSYPDLNARTFAAATNRLLDLAATRLQNGQTVSILPEGTISRLEARTELGLQDIKSGIARVALKASDEHSLIVPIAVAYRNDKRTGERTARHAVVTLGDPITKYESNPLGVRKQVLGAIQTQLDRAHLIIHSELNGEQASATA